METKTNVKEMTSVFTRVSLQYSRAGVYKVIHNKFEENINRTVNEPRKSLDVQP